MTDTSFDLHQMLHIGGRDFPGRLFLAPMAGITDGPMRRICHGMGAALSYTEMISAMGYMMGGRSGELLDIAPEQGPVAVQIFGHDPAVMADAAQKLEAELGPKMALLDINMGCPVRKIAGHGEGSALLKDLPLAKKILRTICGAGKTPVIVKTRIGWSREDVADIIPALCDTGIAALTMHGRTSLQGYGGSADWAALARARKLCSIPFIGNGDVLCLADAQRMMEQTGCDGVMVGRAALGNPWVFSAEKPDICQRRHVGLWHLELEIQQRGEAIAVPLMRKHLAAYIKGCPGAANGRASIHTAKDALAMKTAFLGALRGDIVDKRHGLDL